VIPPNELVLFMLAALGMVLTPGPNMMYLVSRSICQGRAAGLISLAGVVIGFLFYMLSAALGMTVILFGSARVHNTQTDRCGLPVVDRMECHQARRSSRV
jgi:threonine/homoserine/homoserine lactone efflux protein